MREPYPPRTLVLLPTLGDRIELLRETLESIRAQKPYEVDIAMIYPLDKKDAADLADEYGAISLKDPGGLSKALNVGLSVAKAHHEFISWIGDDDLLRENSLQIATDALDRAPRSPLAYGYCDYIESKGTVLFTSKAGKLAPLILGWGPNLIPLPGILFRKTALEKTGGFDPNNRYSMDLDMLLRLRKEGQFINTGKTLAAFRWHHDSMTVANKQASLKESEAVKRKYLPSILRPISFIWDIPVRVASRAAAWRVNRLASKVSR